MNDSTEKMPMIFTDPSQSKATVVILENMQALESALDNMLPVETPEQAEIVSEYRAQSKKQASGLDKERLSMTAPLREVTTRLNQKYNVHIERAERAAKLCDNLLMPYMVEQRKIREAAEEAERIRKAAEAKARQEEEAALAEAQRVASETQDTAKLIEAEEQVNKSRAALNQLRTRPLAAAPAKSIEGALGSKTGLRKVWKYKVVDISLVPEQYLVDPEDRLRKGELNAIAKKDQDNAFVPGITFYYEDTLSSVAATNI